MTSTDSAFRRYRTDGSHEAFREVVAAHLPRVYGTALRLGQGNAAEAEDVSQMVFADLARKAPSLREDASVGAWLHRHTCFLMKNALRGEARRRVREATAVEMHAPHIDSRPSSEQWEEIEGGLDRCLESLREADRRILVLRYFEGRALRDVGEALGIGDDTAQKRVSRALDRLRALVAGRRTGLSSASLAAVMTAKVRAEVPGSVAGSLARSALQLASARSGALAASGGSVAVTAAWAGVAATVALGVWLSWPHWHAQAAARVKTDSRQEEALTKRADTIRDSSGPAMTKGPDESPATSGAEKSGTAVAPVATKSPATNIKSPNPANGKTPEEQEREAASKATTLHKWLIAYALDHGGSFPPDLSALLSKSYGLPVDKAGEWFRPVIEYRGRTLSNSDDGKLVLLRYRTGENTEARVLISGSARTCPVDEPIPEDEAPEPPVSTAHKAKTPAQP
jgi:RNA polymerase sigma factor (sigma-70 family)